MIITTGNYFEDLATAIASGLLTRGKKPKKDALYEMINVHNAQLEAPAAELVNLQDERQAKQEARQEVKQEKSIDFEISWIDAYTVASESYDGFGTHTVSTLQFQDNQGRRVRWVRIHPDHEDWQTSRYLSGNCRAFSREDFQSMINQVFKPLPAPVEVIEARLVIEVTVEPAEPTESDRPFKSLALERHFNRSAELFPVTGKLPSSRSRGGNTPSDLDTSESIETD